jgi:hypothetical protein
VTLSTQCVEPRLLTESEQPSAALLVYRPILLTQGGTELLLINAESGFVLPSIQIDPDRRLAEQANHAVQEQFGLVAYCLFFTGLETPFDSCPIRYVVMECHSDGPPRPRFGSWIPIKSLKGQFFANLEECSAVSIALEQIDACRNGAKLGPFAVPGWMAALRCWTEKQLPPPIHLTGAFQQFNAHPTFSLVRLETNASALWFKAVGEPNLRELAITLALSNLFPSFVVEVIAIRSEWNGWLTAEFEGVPLHSRPARLPWERAFAALGDLQSASADHIEALLGAGCRDLRCGTLLRMVDPFIETMIPLMEGQRKVPPVRLDERELFMLARRLKEVIAEWAELKIPDTLGNLDLNPGNLLISPQRCVFLDWAEAYVGPPFLTFEYLLGAARRIIGDSANFEPDLMDSHLKYWRRFVSADAITRGRALAPLLAVFAYAAGTEIWRDQARIKRSGVGGYLRSLTRRMHREANSLPARGRTVITGYTT